LVPVVVVPATPAVLVPLAGSVDWLLYPVVPAAAPEDDVAFEPADELHTIAPA
jgi:hypothetical protein